MIKKAYFLRMVTLLGAAIFVLSPVASTTAQDGILPAKIISDGTSWVVDKTTRLNGLTIAEGAIVSAPPGHSLTLTVDGASFPVKAGFYEGDVVLTVTDEVIVKYREMAPHSFRSAVYIDDGRLVPEKSVSAAVAGGEVTDTSAKDVTLTSNENNFNGIVVTGKSKYLIRNPVINFTGNGGNDFAGYGAAIASTGHADVTIENAKITTRGAVRTAIFIGGDSTMHVNDSFIDTYNGVLPADYKFNIGLGGMLEAPWVLGLIGNVRSTLVVGNGTVYYNNSHIRTHGWGVLSVDDPTHVQLYATNTIIETVGSGYGAYAVGDSFDHFSRCTFNVSDVGLIISDKGSATFTDGTILNSGRYGVMMHSSSGGALTIEKGTVFNTKSTAIQVKGRGAKIIIDDAKINPANGIILQAMINDDPFAMPPGAAKSGAPGASPVGGPGGAPGPGPGPGAEGAGQKVSNNVTATLRNADLNGDFINSMTKYGDMILTFEKTNITGAISTATAVASTGQAPTRGTYYLIGDVKNTLGATDENYGLKVSLEKGSKWIVDKTSYLTSLAIADGAIITAPKGYAVTMTIDGVKAVIKAGDYKGKIILAVTKA